ncbi:hypothetical protein B9479_006257 [Cryptococcus floricola]|uniref:Uncharacterized protein n=1 Tax=Cryptococcus floricola TaxID=2591691 RepID=A0A5D3AQT7_9TREE|nr:hypothetical protein B9479_006257 [Cryptococcus floricola]
MVDGDSISSFHPYAKRTIPINNAELHHTPSSFSFGSPQSNHHSSLDDRLDNRLFDPPRKATSRPTEDLVFNMDKRLQCSDDLTRRVKDLETELSKMSQALTNQAPKLDKAATPAASDTKPSSSPAVNRQSSSPLVDGIQWAKGCLQGLQGMKQNSTFLSGAIVSLHLAKGLSESAPDKCRESLFHICGQIEFNASLLSRRMEDSDAVWEAGVLKQVVKVLKKALTRQRKLLRQNA